MIPKPHEGYDTNEGKLTSIKNLEINEMRTETSSLEPNYFSNNEQSGNSSSEISSEIDICNMDLDMKDDSLNVNMEVLP